jgi:Skp family chaperone for outer membrane proteins
MKRTVMLLWLGVLSVTICPSQTTGPPKRTLKVVSIDVQLAITSTNEGTRDIAALNKRFGPKVTELQNLKNEIEGLQKQLSTQGDKMDGEARANLVKSIETKQRSFQSSAEVGQKDWQGQANEIAHQILQKMAPIMQKYVQKNQVDAVVDLSVSHGPGDLQDWPNGPLMWKGPSVDKYAAVSAKPESDITSAIIEAYNRQEQTAEVVVADPKTLSFINSLGPEYVFFTSREYPIGRLADITDADTQFGVLEFSPRMMALRQMIAAGSVAGASPPPTPAGQVVLMGIGEAVFGKLFQQNPQLKLFVTPRRTASIDEILDTGGGIRVRFVESKQTGPAALSPP